MRAMRPELLPNGSSLKANRIVFLVLVTVFQLVMILMYGLFLRFPQHDPGTYDKYGVIMSFFLLMFLLVGKAAAYDRLWSPIDLHKDTFLEWPRLYSLHYCSKHTVVVSNQLSIPQDQRKNYHKRRE